MLVEINTSDTESDEGAYVAINANQEVYALVTCSVVGLGNRMYIVDTTTAAFVALKTNLLSLTVVGGLVDDCQYIYLSSGTPGLVLPRG
jgi:hypothetical protein